VGKYKQLSLSVPHLNFRLKKLESGLAGWCAISVLLSMSIGMLSPTAQAQKDAGAIVGTVKDATGGIVSGARVTITDADRGGAFSTVTDSSGGYVGSPLKIGNYIVTVEKEGFKRSVAGPVSLNLQERLVVDVILLLGATSETVTVTATEVHLETETSDLGQVIDSRRAITLPLNGRNYAQLALLGAGVVPSEPGSRTETSYGFSSNGARALQNNFLLDGVDNNANLGDVLNGSAYVIQPSVDAIGEFKVQTNAYSAEFGRGNGAILNAVIKSGTNDFHGDVYEFLRNEKFDAKNANDVFGRQPYKQNQFGATLGGPIVKNRTFFFVDYEGTRIRHGITQVGQIPTSAMVAGDFSSQLGALIPGVTDCSGHPTFAGEIFNARLTQQTGPASFCGVPASPYASGSATAPPTNILSGVSPVASGLATLFPQPNFNGNGNNFLTAPKKKSDQNNFDIRVDHKISQKDDFFTRVSYEDQPILTPGPFSNFLDGGGFADGNQDNAYRSVAVSETHAFSPALVSELRFGYNRINAHRVQANANTDVSGKLGLLGVPFGANLGGLPSFTVSDGAGVANPLATTFGSSPFLPSVEKQNSYVFDGNLTWIRERHTAKFGTEIRKEQFTIFQPSYPRGQLNFSNDLTDNPGAPGTGGEAFASFLLGLPDGGNIVSLHNVDYHRKIFAFYGQDDIRLNARLTINLGLRYEMFRPITEAHNQQGTFDFASGSLIVPTGQPAQLTPYLATLIPIAAMASRGLIKPDLGDVAPRIGLAYKISEKLVMRTGYGIFYGGQENGPFSNPSPGFNPPFFVNQSFTSPCGPAPLFPNANPSLVGNCAIGFNPNGATPAQQQSLMINSFFAPSAVPGAGFPGPSLSDPNTPTLYSLDPHLKTPLTQQWHFGVQYQLPGSTLLDISYGGSHGQRLYAFYNGNQIGTRSDGQPGRPFPAVNSSIATFRSNGFSNYNSLQARLEKNFSHGVQFQFSYTYSHALDDASSANLGSFNNGDFRDQRFPKMEYGNADFDVRHRFVASYIYELPFGKNKAIGKDASGFLNQVIGNWQVSGIVTAATGNYFTVSDPANPQGVDCGGTVTFNCARPNRVGNPNAKPCVTATFFNTCAFISNNGPALYGNAGRNIVRGPGYQEWDLSIFKTFPVREVQRFELRAEFFNIANHVNHIVGPIGALGQAEPVAIEVGRQQYGFTQAARDPRFIQFALKFYF